MVKLLLELAGARRASDFCAVNDGEALIAAAESDDAGVFTLILETLGIDRARDILKQPRYINTEQTASFRALEIGVLRGNTAIVERLLQAVDAQDLLAANKGSRLLVCAIDSPDATMFDRITEALGGGPEVLRQLPSPATDYVARAIGRGHTRAMQLWEATMNPVAWRHVLLEAVVLPQAAKGAGAPIVMDILDKAQPLLAEQLLANDAILFHGVCCGDMQLLEALYRHAKRARVSAWTMVDGQALHGLLEGGHGQLVPKLVASLPAERVAALLETTFGACGLHVAIAKDDIVAVAALVEAYASARGDAALRSFLETPAQSSWSTVMRKYAPPCSKTDLRSPDTAPTTVLEYAMDAKSRNVAEYLIHAMGRGA